MATRSTRNHSLVLDSDIDKNASHSTLDATVNSALRISGNNRVSANATGVLINAPDYCEIFPVNTLSLQSGNALNLTSPAVAVHSTTTELTAANHIKLKIGSATVLNATSDSVICETILKSNVIQLKSGGGMLVNSSGYALDAPNSHHVSGSFATEKRKIVCNPSSLLCDDDSSTRSVQVRDFEDGTYSKNYSGAVGATSGSVETFAYLPDIPEGWRAYAVFVGYADDSTDDYKNEDISVVSRDCTLASSSPFVTTHLALTTGNSGANTVKLFGTKFTPNGQNYMILFIHHASQDAVYLGSYILIERV